MFIDKKVQYFDSVVKNYLSTVLGSYITKETTLLKIPFHSYYLSSSLENKKKRDSFFKELEPHLTKDKISIFNFDDDNIFLISNGNFHFILSANSVTLLDYHCNVIYEPISYVPYSKNDILIRMKINTYLDYCQLEYSSSNNINVYMSGSGKIKTIEVLDHSIAVDFENSFYNRIIYDRDFNITSVEINSAMKSKINSKKKKFNVSNINEFFDEIGEYLDIYTLTNDKSIKSSKFDIYEEQFKLIKLLVNNKYYDPQAQIKYNDIKNYIANFYNINFYNEEIDYFNSNQLKDSNVLEIMKESYVSNNKMHLYSAKNLLLLQKIKHNPEFLFNPDIINKYKYLDVYKENNQNELSIISHKKNKNKL